MDALVEFQDFIRQIATVLTVVQAGVGVFQCYHYYEDKSTGDDSARPYLYSIGISMLMLWWSIMTRDMFGIKLNSTLLTFNSVFLLCFRMYCSNPRDEIVKPLLVCGACVTLIIAYAIVENAEKVPFRYQSITTSLMLLNQVPTILQVKEVVETKDTSKLSFPRVLMGTMVAGAWLLFGLVTGNLFCIIPNFVGFTLNLIKLSLIQVYPKEQTD